jgi:hypothetical protein
VTSKSGVPNQVLHDSSGRFCIAFVLKVGPRKRGPVVVPEETGVKFGTAGVGGMQNLWNPDMLEDSV